MEPEAYRSQTLPPRGSISSLGGRVREDSPQLSSSWRIQLQNWWQDSELSGECRGREDGSVLSSRWQEESLFPPSPGSHILREFANTEPWIWNTGTVPISPTPSQGREAEETCAGCLTPPPERDLDFARFH